MIVLERSTLYRDGLSNENAITDKGEREHTVSELAGLIMAGGLLMRLRSWALRHCSAPWVLRTKRKCNESRASLTACGRNKWILNVNDKDKILPPEEFSTISGNLPSCEAQTPPSTSSEGDHTPRPSAPDGQNWGHWKRAWERRVTGLP